MWNVAPHMSQMMSGKNYTAEKWKDTIFATGANQNILAQEG